MCGDVVVLGGLGAFVFGFMADPVPALDLTLDGLPWDALLSWFWALDGTCERGIVRLKGRRSCVAGFGTTFNGRASCAAMGLLGSFDVPSARAATLVWRAGALAVARELGMETGSFSRTRFSWTDEGLGCSTSSALRAGTV